MTFGRFAHGAVSPSVLTYNSSSTAALNASNKRFAFKFYPQKTMSLTHIDFPLAQTGTPVGVTLQAEIQTDSAGIPSGTPVGAITAAFNAVGGNFQGEQALGSAAAVTVNTPYWLVVSVAAATTLDGANAYLPRHIGGTATYNRGKIRTFNGTDWTTVTIINFNGIFVLKDSDSKYYGFPITGAVGVSGRTDIFGTNRLGSRYKFGCKTTIMGVQFLSGKSGTPSNLEVVVYEGSTQKQIATLAEPTLEANVETIAFFTSPVELSADTFIYFILRQNADGGDNSNDYDIRAYPINSSYISAMLPTDVREVAGTGDDPTALTVFTDEVLSIAPLILDPATDLNETAATGFVPMHSE